MNGELSIRMQGPTRPFSRLGSASKWMLLAVGLATLVSAQPGHTFSAENPVVETESGSVQGMRVGNVTVFKGVPFAAPPVGDLRWRAPRQVDHWNGVKTATSFAPACMQKGVSMPGEVPPTISEDCLYLNIWTPVIGSKEPRAVLVWIYGGGFTNGSASMPLYWGDQLAKRGIVVVTIAYRVGLFGFLAHPDLTLESEHHVSGNYGLLDQIAALGWVQRNIKSFGGDPRRVTIGGQSAGAMAVSILMASPLAHGLFARAIAESGGFLEPVYIVPGYTMASAETQGETYARALGTTDVKSLRKLPAEKLLENDHLAVNHPIIDSFVLPTAPYEIFEAKKQENVPLLLGSNEDEARVFDIPKDIAPLEFDADVARHLGFPVSFLQMFTSEYPHDTAANARQSALDLETDLRFRWDMWTWANHQAHLNDHVYYYLFRHHPPFPETSPYSGWGPSHFAELWYIFDHLNQAPWSWTASDKGLANAAASYWVNFVKSANPNGPGLASWPRYRGDDRDVLYLDQPIATGPVANASRLAALTATYANAASKSSQKQ
jgi:para-nitrobenzyl esterase